MSDLKFKSLQFHDDLFVFPHTRKLICSNEYSLAHSLFFSKHSLFGAAGSELFRGMPVLLIFSLLFFESQFLPLGHVKVLIFEGLHVCTQLAVRGQQELTQVWLHLCRIVHHQPLWLFIVDCPIHLTVELNVFEPRTGAFSD